MVGRTYYSREAQMRAERERTVLALFAIILGIGIGAVVALLLAERPGREVREALGTGIESALEDAQKTAKELQKEVDERLSRR